MDLKEQINKERLPKHVAIIMDGNGRWAKQRGKMRVYGHEQGVTSVRETAEAAAEIGVDYLTLFAFSTENWKRPQHEVEALMQLLVATINSETKTLQDNDIRLKAIGNLDKLDKKCYEELQQAINNTKDNKRMDMILALSYSARWDLTHATEQIARKVKNNELAPEEISQDTVSSHLATAPYPDPELLIRTSGEYRISNFLLWQIAYAELYFTPKLWPDFRKNDFYEAILNFQRRERRFGKISEQVANKEKGE
ncbi:MAG: isoprenyl transferase [Bacteroidales bacterium]|nr:isoprenyl transferase [Bacteroidales bacterium]